MIAEQSCQFQFDRTSRNERKSCDGNMRWIESESAFQWKSYMDFDMDVVLVTYNPHVYFKRMQNIGVNELRSHSSNYDVNFLCQFRQGKD